MSAPADATCRWCSGSGVVQCPAAYVPGPAPFSGAAETVFRAGACKHCRGSGVYDAAQDPTLEHLRRGAS
jgi:hypothetical protein